MAGKIFINYRRDELSIGTAGRLHDRLVQAFKGRKNLFMDVDHIPAGVDFVDHLNTQVAAMPTSSSPSSARTGLDAVLDDSGRRRLQIPGDFVAVEIAAGACARHRLVDSGHDRWRRHAQRRAICPSA